MSSESREIVGGDGTVKGEISVTDGRLSVALNENSGLKRMAEKKRHRWVCYNHPGGYWDLEIIDGETDYVVEFMNKQMDEMLPSIDHKHNFQWPIELPYDPFRIYHQCLGTFKENND
jgi:hypothetical protein